MNFTRYKFRNFSWSVVETTSFTEI